MKEVLESIAFAAVAIIAWGKIAGIALGLTAVIYLCWKFISWIQRLQRIRSYA